MIARLALYDAARSIINHGMRILGLTPVERYVTLAFALIPIFD
jgi:arginyl-tRNA synthetase